MMKRKISSDAWTLNRPLNVFASTNCRPGCGELGAHEHRHEAADEQEEEGGDDVLDADHLVVGVDPEVVLPGGRAVAGVVLGTGRAARGPVEPVVEGAQADEEAERRGDERDGQHRLAVEQWVEPVQRAQPDGSARTRTRCPAGGRGRRGTTRRCAASGTWTARPHFVTLARYATSASSCAEDSSLGEVPGHDVPLVAGRDHGIRLRRSTAGCRRRPCPSARCRGSGPVWPLVPASASVWQAPHAVAWSTGCPA